MSEDLASEPVPSVTGAGPAGPDGEAPLSGSAVQPRLAGTFAIYDDPSDGGLVLVADVDGQGVTRRKVPGAMVAMMTGGGGLAGKALRGLFGRE